MAARARSRSPWRTNERYRVQIKKKGMTCPYDGFHGTDHGKPRMIWPDGKFKGYGVNADNADVRTRAHWTEGKPYAPAHRPGFQYSSNPNVYMYIRDLRNPRIWIRHLCLIDAGATSSHFQGSAYLRQELLKLGSNCSTVAKLEVVNDPDDGQLDGRNMSKNKKWFGLDTPRIYEVRPNNKLTRGTEYEQASWPLDDADGTKGKSLKDDGTGRWKDDKAGRENSVLGLPWMAKTLPYFIYEDSFPSLKDRIAIRLPKDGKKGHYVLRLRNLAEPKKSCFAVFALDTGADCTFPEKTLEVLGDSCKLDKQVDIFGWNAYEKRELCDVAIEWENKHGKKWSHDNSPKKENIHGEPAGAGFSARGSRVQDDDGVQKIWGLLGIDAMIRWKLLVIYDGHNNLVGQRPGVDYLEENVIEPLPEVHTTDEAVEVATSLFKSQQGPFARFTRKA